MPLPGTEDVLVWKTWAYGAANGGVSRVYGVGGTPPARGVITWGSRHTTVDYPPVTVYTLSLIGRAYGGYDPAFRDSAALTVFIKGGVLLAEIALCFAIWALVRRESGGRTAELAVLFCWLNPAIILDGSVLGYLDAWSAAPALGSILAAAAGAPAVAGALLMVAVMTKVQAIFTAPAVALVLWHRAAKPLRAASIASVSAGLAFAALLWPYARAGALPNVEQGVASLLRHDMLSGTAANLWWLVTWIMRAVYAVHDLGAWAAWTMRVRILAISTVVELGYPSPRPAATLAALAVMAWAFWRARHGSVPGVLAACAVAVHAYFVLAVQVHENHLYLAIPMLAAASAVVPRLRAPLVAISAILALNLFLFYGIGRGYALPPRNFTVIDATVLLAALNVGALAWHAARFSAECSTGAWIPRSPAPATTRAPADRSRS